MKKHNLQYDDDFKRERIASFFVFKKKINKKSF